MTNFITTANEFKIDRSEDLAIFASMLCDDIQSITDEDEVDYDHTHFLRLEGSKLVFVIGCMNLEFVCEDVTHAVELLNRTADAAREDHSFQSMFNAAIAHDARNGEFTVPWVLYDGSFLSDIGRHRLNRSNHVRLTAQWLSEDIARLRSGEDCDNGALYSKQGSAYVVNFFSHELEFAVPTLDALLPFLEAAADAVRDDEEFQQRLDETWQRLCDKRAKEREKEAARRDRSHLTVVN